VPRPLVPLADGDSVFGLRIVATPGHTPGHVSVYDAAAGVLVAGDALTTLGEPIALPGAQFTDDMELAKTSIRKLATLSYETLLPGHGDPLEGGASQAVATFAGSL
jgi:glyoxylase-like metal-dependent hydrolase (beta-lactamase superfamily II)